MIELMAVLLVVLIVAALAIPVILKTGRNARLRSAGRQVNVFLRAARHRAITEGLFVHVLWLNPVGGPDNASATIEKCVSRTKAAAPSDWSKIGDPGFEDWDRATGTMLPSGFRFSSAGNVSFYPDGGTGGSGAAIVVQDQNDVQRQVSVTVYAGAGLIEMGIPSE